MRIIAVLCFGLMVAVVIAGEPEYNYWEKKLALNRDWVSPGVSDSLLAIFVNAPEQFQWETDKAGLPLMVIGSYRKLIDDQGRGWLIKCVATWDATSEYLKANGQRPHTVRDRLWSQVTQAILIFVPKEDAKQQKK